jgi:hypothetical protein
MMDATRKQEIATAAHWIRSICAVELKVDPERELFGCKNDEELMELFEAARDQAQEEGAYTDDRALVELLCHG